MRDLSLDKRSIRGQVIANLAELQEFAYEMPEGENPPAALTRLTAGMEVDPVELYEALELEGPGGGVAESLQRVVMAVHSLTLVRSRKGILCEG